MFSLEKPVLKIEERVVECTVIERMNRFTVKVLVGNSIEYAHINNTGRLSEILVSGKIGYCIEINGSKLKYRLFAVDDYGYGALIDTLMQEKAFIQSILNNYIPWLRNCTVFKHNYRLNNSVIDYVLKCNGKNVLVEIKSAVLRINGKYASYPDCPTKRGRVQIENLINYVLAGGTAYLVFIAGLPNVIGFVPNDRADPIIGGLIRKAYHMGVGVKAVNLYYRPLQGDVVLVNPALEVKLDNE